MRHVLGIDAGGTKTRALLADETGRTVASASAGGANLRTHGELAVEKVLHSVIEQVEIAAGARAEALALGIAGADRPDDHAMLRAILSRIGFRSRVVVSNDARVAFVAGSPGGVGLALVRAGGWGWHLADEGSGFWIGEQAMRAAMRAYDGRGPATTLVDSLSDHFGLASMEGLIRAVYDREYPRPEVARFSVRVAAAAEEGDAVAREILAHAAAELVLAARTVVGRLRLEETAQNVVLSGGTFRALPGLAESVAVDLAAPLRRVSRLEEEPAVGAVRLALDELKREAAGA